MLEKGELCLQYGFGVLNYVARASDFTVQIQKYPWKLENPAMRMSAYMAPTDLDKHLHEEATAETQAINNALSKFCKAQNEKEEEEK